MTRVATLLLPIPVLLLVGCPDGKDGGGPGLGEAARSFISFAKEGDAVRPDAVQAGEIPKVVVADRRVDEVAGRRRVDLDLELPMQVTKDQVEAVLQGAVRGPDGRGFAVVRARAWPGKLRHLFGPLGTLIVARDGRGWTGGETFANRLVVSERLGTALRMEEVRALAALDAAAAQGLEGEAAVARAAKDSGLSPEALEDALERGRGAYAPRPTAN